MTIFCACCGKETTWLSMRALCVRCQKLRGAVKFRRYDWRTGKLR